MRDLLFHYKKILLFWLFCSRKSVEIHPALCICPPVLVRANDVNNTESQWNVFVHIRSVVNRSNQDPTVNYGLMFCAFSWPYLVKWHNSGIIIIILILLHLQGQCLWMNLWSGIAWSTLPSVPQLEQWIVLTSMDSYCQFWKLSINEGMHVYRPASLGLVAVGMSTWCKYQLLRKMLQQTFFDVYHQFFFYSGKTKFGPSPWIEIFLTMSMKLIQFICIAKEANDQRLQHCWSY